MALVAGVLLLFSAASVYFVVNSYSFYNSTVAKTIEYKNAIAQYQIKYEGLYEKAYNGKASNLPVELKTTRKPTPIAEKKVNPAPANAPAKGEESAVMKLAAKEAPAKMVLQQDAAEASAKGFHIQHEVEGMSLENNQLSLKIKVENTDRSSRREGFIAAVSYFRNDDGSYAYSSWPERVQVDVGTGRVKDFSKANPYVIKAFKVEQMNFPKPLTGSGKFEKVMLFLSEKDTGLREYSIEVK